MPSFQIILFNMYPGFKRRFIEEVKVEQREEKVLNEEGEKEEDYEEE